MFGKKEKKTKSKQPELKKSFAFRTQEQNPQDDSQVLEQVIRGFKWLNWVLSFIATSLLIAITVLCLHLFFIKDKEIIAFLDGTLAGCVIPAHEMQLQ